MDDDQQFCLRWNNHQSTLISVFDTLLEKGIHVDCTLAAEGQTLKAHKVVLSACSPYFENVLSQQYDKHPIIILKDVKYAELRAMMDYMYRGEVNISQDQLAALLKAAESLQIKGLSDNKPARPPVTHMGRQSSPAHKGSEGSMSREGSASPTRRRKKPRRMSLEGQHIVGLPANLPIPPATAVTVAPPSHTSVPHTPAEDQADLPPSELKVEEGSRGEGEGVEDLTLDEENEEPMPAHNDVVRNFQWHMERSQDEMMNADGARDSQGSAAGKTLDYSVMKQKSILPDKPPTFAVLQNVVIPNKFEESDSKIHIELPFMSQESGSFDRSGLPAELAEKLMGKGVKISEAPTPAKTPKKRVRKPKEPASQKGKGGKKGKATPSDPLSITPTDPLHITPADPLQITPSVQKKKTPAKKATPHFQLMRPVDRHGDKARVYEFDYYSSDSGTPLPCSEYQTDKGFKCPNCPRCYNARKNLVRHVTLECGREPQFQCPYCPYSKHRRNELKKHMQKKHSGEPEKIIKLKVP